jgi:6-phosphofructokinase 1
MRPPQRLGILVGGGPAPGINAVISAATIKALNEGVEVIGIRDGFKHLVRRDTSRLQPLGIDDVSRIHLLGGSMLGTSRENPTKSPEATRAVVETLQGAGITYIVTIGGDDTALSSRYVSDLSGGAIRTVHVPKTIDNDLPLPPHVPTFGFQTARQLGVELVRNLMEDARSTQRWYVVVAMGRKAGHLALGIGKAAGATLTLVAEEWPSPHVSFVTICDVVEGAIIKRRAMGRHFGVAVLAEGLIDKFDPAELAELQDVERDDHGHIRFAEVDLARKVKAEVQGRLSQRGLRVTITNKNVGYELRCADPISFDAEYCRELGYSAVDFLLRGGSGAMVTVQAGRLVPISFDDLKESETGKTKVRLVDTQSEGFRVARAYMIRLEADDFVHAAWVDQLAAAARLTPGEFRERFEYLASTNRERPPRPTPAAVKRIGIVVGGGPAPGTNGVIGAVAIEAIKAGCVPIGFHDGFEWLAQRYTDEQHELTVEEVSRIHLDGGVVLGASRRDIAVDPESLENTVGALAKLKIDALVCVGGDDMVRSAAALERRGPVKVVLVPKSIDDDLSLPLPLATLGYETARHAGVDLVRNLMEDAKTTGRWYLGVTMGRPTGHLTLGIGMAASATCTIIPEEFPQGLISLADIAGIVEGSIIKRRAMGKPYGVVLLSEALVERFSPREVAELQDVDRDAQGNIRVTEIDLGRKVKNEVQMRLEQRDIKVTIVDKTIGYELRCAPPIPVDAEYARDLGYAAVTHLINGGTGALVTIQGGEFAPIPFAELLDAAGKGRRRAVDVTTESYRVAREYMVRLGPRDFSDAAWTASLAQAAGLDEETFRRRFAAFAHPAPQSA